ncbi:fluoride efflux transporter CrcB [Paracoccus sp. SCSIO 75233]|uniref:fluoride efflux transporter CrcB n=1 Tax=Paracoccus sp. SCSIO 75233 TaxID=3017782 RepID=UPI0022F09F64|nr:fluoride efflux transporter CrcB [Paracoccus sp. SCSIO 75233]WBU51844.1 fluoride efflux transporter CrcB [Paracoccus sp. SCSIO 75233]
MMNPFLQVALGGAIGASARYGVYRLIPVHGPGFPVATGVVNILGSFVMGVLAVLMAERLGNHYAPLLLTGVLGGFTTFSAFSLDALTLWERGQAGGAAIYIVASVVLSLAAVIAGLAVGRGIWA